MKPLSLVLPLLLLAGATGTSLFLFSTSPKVERSPPPRPLPVVEVIPLVLGDHASIVYSQGTVTPRTQTTVVAEVSGKILSVSESFRTGGFFEKGDLLLIIDPRNYQTAITIAEAELALQRVNHDQEHAQSLQAKRDWERLGESGSPGDLVLRKPQLAAAKASVSASRARLQQAKTDLERTMIRAPYRGRVLEKKADVGQFVSLGTLMGSIFAIDYVEITLPLSEQDLSKLDLPERFEGEALPAASLPNVRLFSASAKLPPSHGWSGKIVRVAGALDPKTRQPFVIAQVDAPYQRKDLKTPPLKVGQFVEAHITGKTILAAYRVPASSVSVNNTVLLVDGENLIRKKTVSVLAKDRSYLLIRVDIPSAYRLVLTALPLATEAMSVSVKGEQAKDTGKPAHHKGASPP